MWFLLHPLISPKKFVHLTNQLLPWAILFFLILLIYGMVGGLWLAPPDEVQGEGFRIIYVHVPCAFLSLFVYVMMALAAGVGLVFQLKMGFLVVRHSVSMGALFAFLALLTGSVWGKPMWGAWWMWDGRLTSELILLFLYIGIMLFQSATLHKRNGDRATAILVLIGLVDIPIIHYSVTWWNTLHQGSTLNVFKASSMDASMLYPLLAMIAALMLYYAILLS